MTFTEILTDAGSIITQVGTTYVSLSENFGGVLQVPVAIVVSGAIVGIMKSLLMFRRARGRR